MYIQKMLKRHFWHFLGINPAKFIVTGHIAMPKNAEDAKMMQEKDAKIKDLEEKCKKLVSYLCRIQSYCSNC